MASVYFHRPASIPQKPFTTTHNKSTLRFNRLPIEIQFDVFATLPVKTLCSVIAPVCRQWRQFAYDPRLWISLRFSETEKQTASQILNVLNHSTHIRRLLFCDFLDFKWINALSSVHPTLREIEFEDCEISVQEMSLMVQHFPHVQRFDELSYRSDLSYVCPHTYLTQQIVKWDYLVDITLARYGDAHLDVITETCINLTCFNAMFFDSVSDSSFIKFLQKVGPQLRVLRISGLYDMSSNVFDYVALCRRLVKLELEEAVNFTNGNFFKFRKLKDLRELNISGSEKLFGSIFRAIFPELKFPSVESVVFIDCLHLNYTCLNCFIKRCKSIRHLTVSLSKSLSLSSCTSLAERHNFHMEQFY